MPVISDASSMFGVITQEMGTSLSINEDTASCCSNASPLLATITGSKTYFSTAYSSSFWATVSMIPALDSIPVLHASTLISVNTASICFPTNAGGMSCIPKTPTVFCAVTDVTTDVPYTCRAANVFKSACIPAPPPESDPAIVNVTFMASPFQVQYRSQQL